MRMAGVSFLVQELQESLALAMRAVIAIWQSRADVRACSITATVAFTVAGLRYLVSHVGCQLRSSSSEYWQCPTTSTGQCCHRGGYLHRTGACHIPSGGKASLMGAVAIIGDGMIHRNEACHHIVCHHCHDVLSCHLSHEANGMKPQHQDASLHSLVA